MNIDFCMRLCEFVFLFHLDKNLKHGFVVFFFFFLIEFLAAYLLQNLQDSWEELLSSQQC